MMILIFYHVQNHFAHVHYVNFEVAKQEKYQRQQEDDDDEDDDEEENQLLIEGEQRIEVLEDMDAQFNDNGSNPNDDPPSVQKQSLKPSAKSTPLNNSATKRKGIKK